MIALLIFGVTQVKVILEEVNIPLRQDKNNVPSKTPQVGLGRVGCTQRPSAQKKSNQSKNKRK